jgi:hypothetical protein
MAQGANYPEFPDSSNAASSESLGRIFLFENSQKPAVEAAQSFVGVAISCDGGSVWWAELHRVRREAVLSLWKAVQNVAAQLALQFKFGFPLFCFRVCH